MNPIARARGWRSPLHALVMTALLLSAQALGLAHRAAHGGHSSTQAHASAWLDGHKAGTADCRLIDQLGHADLGLGPHVDPPGLPTPAAASAVHVAVLLGATPALGYSARGPPQLSRSTT